MNVEIHGCDAMPGLARLIDWSAEVIVIEGGCHDHDRRGNAGTVIVAERDRNHHDRD